MILTLVSASLVLALPLQEPHKKARERFNRGKTLIERNCGTCYGDSRAGMEEGVAEVREAIKLGYPDKIQAYKLLGEAYNDLRYVFSKADTPERESYVRKQAEVYEALYELAPEDPEAMFRYAVTREEQAETMRLLRSLIEMAPEYADAYSVLGLHLRRQGQVQEALEMRLQAILLYEDPARVRSRVKALLAAMKSSGCDLSDEEEGTWHSDLDAAWKAMKYHGDRKKLEKFKTDFSTILESHTCPEIAGPRGGDQ